MATRTKLMLLRSVHTAIFMLMVSATMFVAYSGLTGYRGPVLVTAIALVIGEALVLMYNRMECPLTGLARRYGSTRGWALDWALSEKWAHRATRAFGIVFAVGLALVLAR